MCPSPLDAPFISVKNVRSKDFSEDQVCTEKPLVIRFQIESYDISDLFYHP